MKSRPPTTLHGPRHLPRPPGSAVDYDALLGGQETITRALFAAGIAQAPHVESGTTQVGLMAEHGLSPGAMVTNADRLGIDMFEVNAVVLSHGHFDHAGGLPGLAGRRGTTSLAMVVHPQVWTRRRLALPGGSPEEWPR